MMVDVALLRINVTCNCPAASLALYDDWLKFTVAVEEQSQIIYLIVQFL